MKLLLISFFVGAFALSSEAQSYDSRLTKLYSTEELNALSSENPEKLTVLNYALDHALTIVDLPTGKEAKLNGEIVYDMTIRPDLSATGLKISESNQYYRITGTNKVLMVKSFFVLNQEMNSVETVK